MKLKSFYKRLAKKKPKAVAKTATARKLLVKLAIMLRDTEENMMRMLISRRMTAAAMAVTMWLVPVAASAQVADIKAPKNKYKVSEDVKLGSDAAREINAKFPLVEDYEATNYVSRVGQRLVDRIPAQFRQSSFNYTFKIVNASDLNAFALPGGPMYINRGMIERARNRGRDGRRDGPRDHPRGAAACDGPGN